MNFEYSAEQVELRKSIREFAEAEIAPKVLEWDEAQFFPLEVIKKAGQLGIMGAIFPEDLGGAGLGYIEYSIVIEELARVDPSVALIVAAHNSLCTNHIFLAGDEAQKRKYIPKLATGEWIGCWSLTEPEAGSDAAGTRSTAVLKDGEWVLNGGKTFTTNAHYAEVCVAMAVTDRGASQHGISAFILEKGTAGFKVGKKENKLGMRASATGEVLRGFLLLTTVRFAFGEKTGDRERGCTGFRHCKRLTFCRDIVGRIRRSAIEDLGNGGRMGPNIVRRQLLRRVAKQIGGVVRALVTDGNNLTDTVLCEHPFERLASDIVAVGANDAGGQNDFGIDRCDDPGRSDPQLRSGRGRDCSGRRGYGK